MSIRTEGILSVLCLVMGLAGSHARAVIISTATGDGNTTAPSGFAYWDNIGTSQSGTDIYLGNRWVLTAHHVGAKPVTFAGTVYNPLPATTIRLVNDFVTNTPIDLILFRLDADPGLPAMPLPTHAPAKNNAVTLIGNGFNRQADLTYWDSSWNVVADPNAYSGWYWDTSGRTTRWGTNTVTSMNQTTDIGHGPTTTFSMNFDTSSGNEAMAAPGDSGGPVFYRSGTSFTLMGLISAMGAFAGQPNAAVRVFMDVGHDVTYAADLYYYRAQLSPREGDANNDGMVDMTDFNAWYNNYGTGTTWAQADFKGYGVTDMTDFNYWYNLYGQGAGSDGPMFPDPAALAQGAPEPATAAMLLAGLAAIGCGRRRKNTCASARRRA